MIQNFQSAVKVLLQRFKNQHVTRLLGISQWPCKAKPQKAKMTVFRSPSDNSKWVWTPINRKCSLMTLRLGNKLNGKYYVNGKQCEVSCNTWLSSLLSSSRLFRKKNPQEGQEKSNSIINILCTVTPRKVWTLSLKDMVLSWNSVICIPNKTPLLKHEKCVRFYVYYWF